jgi:N6-adenosine-specific RNA methylase IME4
VTQFATIVADPPWPFRWSGGAGGAHRNSTPLAYSLMSLDDIKAVDVAAVAAEAAHLFMWVTPELHRKGEGAATAEAWGFDVVDEIIWEKPNIGMGVFPRHVHEPLLIARRGDLPFSGPRNIRSVQKWSQRHAGNGGGKVHSAKPDAALDLIEQVSPGPYLEVFARRARFGWEYAGDGSHGTVEIPGLRAPGAVAA